MSWYSTKVIKKAIVIRVLYDIYDKKLTDEEQQSVSKDIDLRHVQSNKPP